MPDLSCLALRVNFLTLRKENKMSFVIALMLCLLSFAPVSSAAKSLDTDKFLASGSSRTDLRAPKEDPLKAPGDHSTYGPNTPPPAGGKRPVPPVNGVCTFPYYCNSTNHGATLICMPGGTLRGEQRCSDITYWCNLIDTSRAAGHEIDESDAEKYVRFCT